MNTELLEALNILEKEKEISKETLLDAIENSLLNACKNHFGKADNIKVIMDHETCDYQLFAEKTVVETVEDPLEQISLDEASQLDPDIMTSAISLTCSDRIQIIWTYCNTECKEPDPSENPRGRAESGI